MRPKISDAGRRVHNGERCITSSWEDSAGTHHTRFDDDDDANGHGHDGYDGYHVNDGDVGDAGDVGGDGDGAVVVGKQIREQSWH